MSKIFEQILRSNEFREEHFVAEAQARLAKLMDEKGVTRAELARKLDVSRARITQIFSDEASNLTLRLLARGFLALGEEPIILTKGEYERLMTAQQDSASHARPERKTSSGQEVLTASLIAELLRSSEPSRAEVEKSSRRTDSVQAWKDHGSNVISLADRRAANG